ncbi:MAG: hypothetical protein VX676_02965, partial [Pseudomonadota bacterium]|nr:hypothetical protein [Pseudomonadota bacterium]
GSYGAGDRTYNADTQHELKCGGELGGNDMRDQMRPDIFARAKAEPDECKYRQRHNAGQRQTAPQPAIAPNLAWGA